MILYSSILSFWFVMFVCFFVVMFVLCNIAIFAVLFPLHIYYLVLLSYSNEIETCCKQRTRFAAVHSNTQTHACTYVYVCVLVNYALSINLISKQLSRRLVTCRGVSAFLQ